MSKLTDDTAVEVLVGQAGLEATMAAYPEDIRYAIGNAATLSATIRRTANVRCEPVPNTVLRPVAAEKAPQ